MGHAGEQRTQGCQFFRLHQLLLPQFQFVQHTIEGGEQRDDLLVVHLDIGLLAFSL